MAFDRVYVWRIMPELMDPACLLCNIVKWMGSIVFEKNPLVKMKYMLTDFAYRIFWGKSFPPLLMYTIFPGSDVSFNYKKMHHSMVWHDSLFKNIHLTFAYSISSTIVLTIFKTCIEYVLNGWMPWKIIWFRKPSFPNYTPVHFIGRFVWYTFRTIHTHIQTFSAKPS